MNIKDVRATKISHSKPNMEKGKNCPDSLKAYEDGVAEPRDYKCNPIVGKSDTGTFGGSYQRGNGNGS